MKFPSPFRFTLLLAGLALIAPTLPAAQSTQTIPSAAEASPARFTLEIRGGFIVEGGKQTEHASVGNILEYLKKKNNEFSLSLGPSVAEVVVGDMILHMERFDIGAICSAIVNSANEPLAASVNDPLGPPDQRVSALMAVPQQRLVAVFNLTGYLNPHGNADDKTIQNKLASVTDIIFKTLKDADPMFSDAVQPHYQFHQGANLLVVTGTEQAIGVAREVVNALNQPMPSTARRGGFIPEGTSIPDPAAWNYTPGPDYPKAPELPAAAANLAQAQAIIDALRKAQAQGSLAPEQMKQYQQHIDELNKLMQDAEQQIKSIRNNGPLIIQGGNAVNPATAP